MYLLPFLWYFFNVCIYPESRNLVFLRNNGSSTGKPIIPVLLFLFSLFFGRKFISLFLSNVGNLHFSLFFLSNHARGLIVLLLFQPSVLLIFLHSLRSISLVLTCITSFPPSFSYSRLFYSSSFSS